MWSRVHQTEDQPEILFLYPFGEELLCVISLCVKLQHSPGVA